MNNIILFDDDTRDGLLPLTYNRPMAELRIGITTIKEKWERHLNGRASYITQDYLQNKFPIAIGEDNFVINGSVLPTEQLGRLILQLETNEAVLADDELVAARLNRVQFDRLISNEEIEELSGFDIEDTPYIKINRPHDMFQSNGDAIRTDYKMLTEGRNSQPISFTNRLLGEDKIFLEEGVKMESCSLNATTGPIYIAKGAEIMEGSMLRGPLVIGENAVVKMGAKIYGGTTIGPWCKVGGEINNSILLGYSNKAHDGFLGNSVIGEWCNLGADTNNSNLKNNYSEVKLWSYTDEKFVPTGTQFCGLVMGDHSKCGINTMFNTGTTVGFSCNIFGAGYPRNFIPSFSWGGSNGYTTYGVKRALETAQLVMERRHLPLTDEGKAIFQSIFESSQRFRSWEK